MRLAEDTSHSSFRKTNSTTQNTMVIPEKDLPTDLPTTLTFARAYYIKLGQGGWWEGDSLGRGIMRIGWSTTPLAEIHADNWGAIEARLRTEQPTKATATRAVTSLQEIVRAAEDDIWITFHSSKLWWCRLAAGSVEEDEISKFRRVRGAWSDRDIHGKVLMVSEIPGAVSQLQGFRRTVCSVRAIDGLRRVLNGVPSSPHQSVARARNELIQEVEVGVRQLHWKDFETLIDLIFRNAGWRRLSVLGETMKYADLELEEPVTGDRYQVQIKSAADSPDFFAYRDQFSGKDFRKLFFVVHTPSDRLERELSTQTVELILPARLAQMVVDAGLVPWILAKIR